MPVRTYMTADQSGEELIKVVSDADKKQWVMACGCDKEELGLYSGHAYTLLGSM